MTNHRSKPKRRDGKTDDCQQRLCFVVLPSFVLMEASYGECLFKGVVHPYHLALFAYSTVDGFGGS